MLYVNIEEAYLDFKLGILLNESTTISSIMTCAKKEKISVLAL